MYGSNIAFYYISISEALQIFNYINPIIVSFTLWNSGKNIHNYIFNWLIKSSYFQLSNGLSAFREGPI